jgi:CRISPR-associated protein Cmr4
MFEASRLLFLYAETPLHAGTGAGLGAVDLPVQRERATGYPLVQASSLKGVLRSEARGDPAKIEAVFGPGTDEAHKHAGALSTGDARLLLFPVRSLLGVFAWTTSAHVLARFLRDAEVAGISPGWEVPKQARDMALVSPGSDLIADGQLLLEEFAFTAEEDAQVKRIAEWLAEHALPEGEAHAYWRNKLPHGLAILPENDFREFTRFSTEVVTRVQIDPEKKTVKPGALWTEENLPTDTLFYAPLYATKPRTPDDSHSLANAEAVLDSVQNLGLERIQLGGNETIGRGIVALRWAKGDHQQ